MPLYFLWVSSDMDHVDSLPIGRAEKAYEDYLKAWNPSSLNDAIDLSRAESTGAPNDTISEQFIGARSSRNAVLLCQALLSRYTITASADDLLEQIHLAEVAIESALSRQKRNLARCLLGTGLRHKHEHAANGVDLERAVELHRQVVIDSRLHGDDELPEALGEFGRSLMRLYQRSGNEDDLQRALESHHEALSLYPEGHCNQAVALFNLADTTWVGHSTSGTIDDLHRSVELHVAALKLRPIGHPERVFSLNGLGGAYLSLYDQRSNPKDLDQSSAFHREALTIRIPGHPDRFKSLCNLASGCSMRYAETNNIDDLNEAMQANREAYELCPPTSPFNGYVLNSLASCYIRRFENTGRFADFEEFVLLRRRCLTTQPPGHQMRTDALNNLGSALRRRFLFSGDPRDLIESIMLLRELVSLTRPDGPYFSMSIATLTLTLVQSYKHFHQPAYIEEVLSIYRSTSTRWQPGQRGWGSYLAAVAEAFAYRHTWTNDVTDLDSSISLNRASLARHPSGDVLRKEGLRNTAIALNSRFSVSHRAEDADEAMQLLQEAQELTHVGHPDRARNLFVLAKLYSSSASSYFSLRAAIDCVRLGLQDQFCHAFVRVQDAQVAFEQIERLIESGSGDASAREGLLQSYALTLCLLPQVAFVGLRMRSQLQVLAKAENLANNASAHAIALGKPDVALDLLEDGRAVFWSQYLKIHSRFNDYPLHMQKQLSKISAQLRTEGEIDRKNAADNNELKIRLDVQAAQQRQLGEQFEALLGHGQDVRHRITRRWRDDALLDALKEATRECPMVVLLGTKASCNAILVQSPFTSPQVVELPGIKMERIGQLARVLKTAVLEGRSAAQTRGLRAMVKVVKGTLRNTPSDDVLKELWDTVMKPIVNALGFQKRQGRERSRLFICATGAFTHLPIHAAGFTGKEQAEEYCSDYCVSSYIPTLGALINAQKNSRRTLRRAARVMLAAVPHPRKWAALPYVLEEVEIVKSCVPPEIPLKISINASHASITAAIPEAAILHFACHGFQDRADALSSGFVLCDKTLSVLELMAIRLPRAFFAFLSACETAKCNEAQPDEAIHLAATMLFAGVPSVVGTIWSMGDVDGPVVAKTVYEALFSGDAEYLDHDKVPYALDDAIRELRRRGLSSSRWATYVHLGV